MTEENLPPAPKKQSWLKEIVQFALIAIIIVVPFRMFVAQPFIVSGASMDPTFETGEYLIVDQVTYRIEDPQRGSVIIFKYPKDPSRYYIKRVIGLPSETVEIKGGVVTIHNKNNIEGFIIDEPYVVYKKEDHLKVTLADNEYFVMGDNRIGSSDSRAWGPVADDLIVGRPLLRLLPLSGLSFFPGDIDR